MDNSKQDGVAFVFFRVTNPFEYRAALARLRALESAPPNSALAQERTRLELAVSRYLATGGDRKAER